MTHEVSRRQFIQSAAVIGGAAGLSRAWGAEPAPAEPEPLQPIGKGRGIHPGQIVWVHDPKVTDWKGPGQDAGTTRDTPARTASTP